MTSSVPLPKPSTPHLILVVDDNATVLMATVRVLEWAGYRVAQAVNGAEAMEKVRALRPSLVLLDVVLPDTSGEVVLSRIRADPDLAAVSVVLLSSLMVSAEHQASGLDAGADGYMARPIAHAELIARVRLHLRQRELTDQLRASEARLVAAQAVAKVGSWETDLETMKTIWSEETHRIFETDPVTFAPSHPAFLELVHPEDRAAVKEAFLDSLGNDAPARIEHRVCFSDGRVKYLEERWRVMHDQHGQARRALGTCQDITERKQADQKIRERDAMLRMAGKAARLGAWTIELPARTLTWSDENCAIHDLPPGYKPTLEEGIGYFLPEHRAEVIRYVDACEKDGTPYEFDLPKITAKGRRIWVRSIGEAARDAEGKIIRLQGAIQDITERKQAEEGLVLFRRLVDQSNDGIYVAEASTGRLLDANESACRQLGYERGELLQLSVLDINQEIRTPQAWARHVEMLRLEGSTVKEFTCRRKDGSNFPVEVSLRHIQLNQRHYILAAARDITERKRSEAALREREAELRALAESMPQMVWMNRPDGLNYYINQRWVEYTGLSPEESYGRGWIKAFHPDDQPRAVEAWENALGGGDYNLECRLRRVDGAYRWMLVRGLPLRDLSGEISKWMGTCTDIDDLKTSQRALQMLSRSNTALVRAENENLLLEEICKIAVEIGGFRMAWVGYVQEDAQRSIVPQAWAGVEEGYFKTAKICVSDDVPLGLGPSGQAIRTGKVVLVPDLSRDESFAPWREAALQRGYRGLVSLPLKNKTEVFGVLGLVLPEVREIPTRELRVLRELADNLAFGITTLRIQTEQRRAQEEIKQQAALIDHAQDAIIVLDLERRVTFWNRGAERLYGWSSTEALGRWSDKLMKIDPAVYADADRMVREKGEWSGELQAVSKSHAALTVNGRWTLMRDEEGRPKSILRIDTDITESKKLEAQFLRAQRMDSIGTLAGGIAHDLNNLLSPVLMGIGLLKHLDPRENVLDVLNNIERSARRGADLVKQVLSYARGVEGARVSLHLDQVLGEIESIVTNTFPKAVTFERRAANDLRLVVGDPTQIKQVVLNLCVNARDAMPNGGHLLASVRNFDVDENFAARSRDAKTGRYVLLEISDTGMGIEGEIIDRIFEPFFTTKELGKGTGLGLSTALGIVRSHGGFLNVSSTVGKGSVFSVYLPASEQAPPDCPEEGESRRVGRGNGELILVVDDDSAVLDMTKRTLQHFGYRIMAARNGTEGLTLYSKHRDEIALVLTDMMMPVMDGPAFIVALRQRDPVIRIVGASGLNAISQANGTVGAEMNDFINKPFSAEGLVATVQKVLSKKSDLLPSAGG